MEQIYPHRENKTVQKFVQKLRLGDYILKTKNFPKVMSIEYFNVTQGSSGNTFWCFGLES